MPYRYDLHCHTDEGSKCSSFPAKDMVEHYVQLGYSGINITDHFSGMTPLPDETPWDERVSYYYDVYLKAREAGEKAGLSVFFGLEYSLAPDIDHMSQSVGNDFLLLNITKEMIIANKNDFIYNPAGMYAGIRAAGGFVVHAHPYYNITALPEKEHMLPFARSVDAVEVVNTGRSDDLNRYAREYARMFGLPETAGTDLHSVNQLTRAGVETPTPCPTAADLVAAIRAGRTRLFTIVDGNFQYV